MACFESGTVVTLAAREVITLPHVRGATLRVTQGTLWLTEERDRHDVVLRPGDNWLIESDGNTVVEAQDATMFCVVGRNGATLQLPGRQAAPAGILSTLAAWLTPTPRHHAPYA